MARKYTEIDQIQNYILTTVDVDFAYQVDNWIEQITKYIENTTGRVFIADEATEKIYDGNGTKEIYIDEFTSIEKVTVDGVEIAETDYYIYPNNQENKHSIVLDTGVFTKDYQNVVVEAKWGYSREVPQDLAFATTILVAGIINHSLSHEGEVQSFSMGRYSVVYKDEKGWNDYKNAMAILDNYKRYTF